LKTGKYFDLSTIDMFRILTKYICSTECLRLNLSSLSLKCKLPCFSCKS